MIRMRPCMHCTPKLDRIDETLPPLEIAIAAAQVFRQCRKCLAQLPRSMRPKRTARITARELLREVQK